MLTNSLILTRLLLAGLLSGLIGLERETKHKPAGIRTNILVGVGSTLFTLMSVASDQFTIAANIVSGIGFLGAGLIMREEGSVHGITTASAVWMVAGIGLAVGLGYYMPAIFATLITLAALILSRDDKLVRWFGPKTGKKSV